MSTVYFFNPRATRKSEDVDVESYCKMEAFVSFFLIVLLFSYFCFFSLLDSARVFRVLGPLATRFPSTTVRTSRLAERLLALRIRSNWKKIYTPVEAIVLPEDKGQAKQFGKVTG